MSDVRFQDRFWKLCDRAFQWHPTCGQAMSWGGAVAWSLKMDQSSPGPALPEWPNFTGRELHDLNEQSALMHIILQICWFPFEGKKSHKFITSVWKVAHLQPHPILAKSEVQLQIPKIQFGTQFWLPWGSHGVWSIQGPWLGHKVKVRQPHHQAIHLGLKTCHKEFLCFLVAERNLPRAKTVLKCDGCSWWSLSSRTSCWNFNLTLGGVNKAGPVRNRGPKPENHPKHLIFGPSQPRWGVQNHLRDNNSASTNAFPRYEGLFWGSSDEL